MKETKIIYFAGPGPRSAQNSPEYCEPTRTKEKKEVQDELVEEKLEMLQNNINKLHILRGNKEWNEYKNLTHMVLKDLNIISLGEDEKINTDHTGLPNTITLWMHQMSGFNLTSKSPYSILSDQLIKKTNIQEDYPEIEYRYNKNTGEINIKVVRKDVEATAKKSSVKYNIDMKINLSNNVSHFHTKAKNKYEEGLSENDQAEKNKIIAKNLSDFFDNQSLLHKSHEDNIEFLKSIREIIGKQYSGNLDAIIAEYINDFQSNKAQIDDIEVDLDNDKPEICFLTIKYKNTSLLTALDYQGMPIQTVYESTRKIIPNEEVKMAWQDDFEVTRKNNNTAVIKSIDCAYSMAKPYPYDQSVLDINNLPDNIFLRKDSTFLVIEDLRYNAYKSVKIPLKGNINFEEDVSNKLTNLLGEDYSVSFNPENGPYSEDKYNRKIKQSKIEIKKIEKTPQQKLQEKPKKWHENLITELEKEFSYLSYITRTKSIFDINEKQEIQKNEKLLNKYCDCSHTKRKTFCKNCNDKQADIILKLGEKANS